MKFIYILEDDERTQKDLFDTIKSIDPKLCIRFFPNLGQFHDWLKLAQQEGPQSLVSGGQAHKDDTAEAITPDSTHELRMVIAKNELLGIKNMGLIKRAREFFLRKKICSEQAPTALILTAFDGSDFDAKNLEFRFVSNVIFKPFDKLILKQHLENALSGHNLVKSDTISAIKINSTIEMLKEIQIQSISEVGFSALNSKAIEIGTLSKYYGDIFKSEDKKSVYAYCQSCKEISPNEFQCEFHFFGADNNQISQIRRHILQNKSQKSIDLKNSHGMTTHILILDKNEQISQEIKSLLNDKFSNVETYLYSQNAQLLSDLADKESTHRQTLPRQFDLVFANYDFLEAEKKEHWEQLCKQFSDRATKGGLSQPSPLDLYLISRTRIPVDTMRELTTWVKEVFYTHLDKTYVYKRMISQQPKLANRQTATISHLEEQAVLKAANPVDITEISEGGLVIKYHREMDLGEFREFILWRPDELENPEILGKVNFIEKDKKEKDTFWVHFVFFGMKDFYLKHIRLWLRGAYIKGKEKG